MLKTTIIYLKYKNINRKKTLQDSVFRYKLYLQDKCVRKNLEKDAVKHFNSWLYYLIYQLNKVNIHLLNVTLL